jgi:predicted nucleic acid-binding protein
VPFSVVYDACVLYPSSLRDLLVRVALAGIVQARWSDQILDEVFQSVSAKRPELDTAALQRTRDLMNAALPAACVRGHETLIAGLSLPDPGDRHVLAAAIRSGAQTIVTFNLRDFPSDVLAGFDIEAKHPDDFLMNCIDISSSTVMQVITEQAADYWKPPFTVPELFSALRGQGLVQSIAKLNALRSNLMPPGF